MRAGYKRWQDIRGRGKSPERLARVAGAVERELLEMDLRAVRKLLGKSQAEVARAVEMSQSEVSRLERRQDIRVSTLRRVIEALGGKVEIVARFGDKRVRLRAAG